MLHPNEIKIEILIVSLQTRMLFKKRTFLKNL